MSEFFAGIQGLNFWQWIGLILLAAVLRGPGPVLFGSWTRKGAPSRKSDGL